MAYARIFWHSWVKWHVRASLDGLSSLCFGFYLKIYGNSEKECHIRHSSIQIRLFSRALSSVPNRLGALVTKSKHIKGWFPRIRMDNLEDQNFFF